MRKTSVMVADLIRDGILEGRLRPGERLKEDMLAKELDVSRTPVREAIAMLQAEGLLDAHQHRGAQVRSYTPSELEEIYDLRSILEGYAARRAATRITQRELTRLRTSVERMEKLQPKDLEHLVQQNGIFHDTILQAADSQRLVAMVTQTRALPLIYQSYAWYTPAQLSLSLEYHRRVLSALERHDAEQAEYDMRHHLFNAREALTSAYAEAAELGRRAAAGHPGRQLTEPADIRRSVAPGLARARSPARGRAGGSRLPRQSGPSSPCVMYARYEWGTRERPVTGEEVAGVTSLRERLSDPRILVAVGAHDGLTATLAERAGLEAVYQGGYAVAAHHHGLPDIGLVGLSDVAESLRRITAVARIPVIVDADTGYGSEPGVRRSVLELESAGAAAVQIEDQVFPKRCGHMEGKQVIPRDDMVLKVRAAVDARRNPDTVIIARTDALQMNGLDDAIDRCNAYAEAGRRRDLRRRSAQP